MATKVKARPHPKGTPAAGTYVVDCDSKELFRVEAIHRHQGIVLENARTYALFMLTFKEFETAGFKAI